MPTPDPVVEAPPYNRIWTPPVNEIRPWSLVVLLPCAVAVCVGGHWRRTRWTTTVSSAS